MFPRIFCVMFSGRSLTERISEVLFINAHEMVEFSLQKRRVKGRDYDGIITTDLESVAAFGTTGIIFQAQIGFDGGATDVEFLIRVGDLDRPIESYNLKFVDTGKYLENLAKLN
jgi:hypothetical protein